MESSYENDVADHNNNEYLIEMMINTSSQHYNNTFNKTPLSRLTNPSQVYMLSNAFIAIMAQQAIVSYLYTQQY